MKALVDGKVYDTDTSYLIKYVVRQEDLGSGYIRLTEMGLYYRKKKNDYFLYIRKIATEGNSKVIDIQDYFYPASVEFARSFNRKYDDSSLLTK